jgi:RimJ/RimL family protein N-acetyltransferase
LKPGETVAEFEAKDGRHVVLRVLKKGDLDELVRFANRVAIEKRTNRDLGIVSFDGRMTRKDEKEFLDGVIEGLKKGGVLSIAAFVDGEMVGHCDVRRRRPRDLHHTGVFGIVIHEGYRNLGIGGRMMTAILREAARTGVWLVELTVFARNEAAIHLYEKMGFKRVGVVPRKIQRDGRLFDEMVMFADLRGSDKSPSKGRGKS